MPPTDPSDLPSIRRSEEPSVLPQDHRGRPLDWPALIVEHLEEALFTVDREWRFTYLNPHATLLLGQAQEALLGRVMWELFPSLLGTSFEHLYRQVLATGAPGQLEDWSATAQAWYEVRATPIPQGLVVAFWDITERKRLERSLSESEARFKVLSDASFEAVVIHQAGVIVEANESAAQMLGFAGREECLGQPISGLIAPESAADVQQRIAAGYDGVYQTVAMRSDGRRFPIEGRGRTMMYQGEPTRVMSLRDITERVQAEAQLRAHATRMEILAQVSHAFAEVGLDYQVLLNLVTQKMVEMLGDLCVIRLHSDEAQTLPLVAMHYHNPADLDTLETLRTIASSPSFRTSVPDINQQVFEHGRPVLLPEVDLPTLLGMVQPVYRPVMERLHPHSLLVVPLRVWGHVIGILDLYRSRPHWPPFTEDDLRLAQDLADRAALAIENARLYQQAQRELVERQRAEQALEAERAMLARRVAERTADLSLANAQLLRASRLKDEFLANMSHELRTPLNAVMGRAQALQEEIYGPVTEEQVKALQHIEESGQHLLTLINDILDLSKIESGQLTLERSALDVDLFCAMSLRMVSQMAIAKRLTLTSTLDGQVETLHADERRLKQVLVNLLANAVKFTPEGGKVGLEVRGDPARGSVTFTVWDTGIGIAAENLPRLFQPFVQLDNSLNRQHAGTGLGLALVMRLAKAHGGGVAVESTPGQGSRFSVTLPWDPQEQSADRTPASAVVDTSRPRVQRALVVEDSTTAAGQVARYLRELGAEVEVLPYGADTVTRASALQPDVILLDLLLPDQDGWDVLRALKEDPQTQDIPVLIVSVVHEPARARAQGAAGLLGKPLDQGALLQVLRQLFPQSGEPLIQTALIIAPSPQQPRILLAEDYETNILTFSDYLQAKGYEVLVARNGSEAVVRAQEERPELILMDIQMPGMDGLEAIQRIRADRSLSQVPIIALTALAMPGDRERCLGAGASAYLAKPVSLRLLLATIEKHRSIQPSSSTTV